MKRWIKTSISEQLNSKQSDLKEDEIYTPDRMAWARRIVTEFRTKYPKLYEGLAR